MRRKVVWVRLMPLFLVIAAVLGFGAVIAACSSAACGTSADCGGTCTVLARDRENCGACGNKCAAGLECSFGMCTITCPTGTTKCGDACVVTSSDPLNCGACGTKCPVSQVCSASKCSDSCGVNLTQCGASCVSVQSDATNCGMCGKACAMGESCVGGMCGFSCMSGLAKCMSTDMNPPADASVPEAGPGTPICVDLQNNDRHCGACGNFCYGSQKCSGGKCSNCTLCGGKCLDTANDDNNCGKCANTCAYDGGMSSCKNNYCCRAKITNVYLQDDFRDSSKGWTLDTQWAIGAAKASVSCSSTPGQDPSTDHSGLGDNGIAGIVIGGCTGTSLHAFYYMTSAQFDSSAATKVVLSYWRHLHADWSSYQSHRVEVYDGAAWQVVYQNPDATVADSKWNHFAYDVTQYKNNKMQVRFGYDQNYTDSSAYNAAGWNVDDVLVADEDCAP